MFAAAAGGDLAAPEVVDVRWAPHHPAAPAHRQREFGPIPHERGAGILRERREANPGMIMVRAHCSGFTAA